MSQTEETEVTRAVVQAAYRHFAAGEIEAAAERLAKEIDWAVAAPRAVLGYAGRRAGRLDVLAAFREITQLYEFIAYQPRLVVAEHDLAAVYTSCVLRDLESGHGGCLELSAVMRVRNGQIVWFREHLDVPRLAALRSGALAEAANRMQLH